MKLLYGSQNFGYSLPTSDEDWMEFIYPSWSDIIDNNITIKEVVNTDGSHIKRFDIRVLHNIVERPNITFLQFMYSTKYIECDDLKWFIDNRDRIIKANKYKLFKSSAYKLIDELRTLKAKNTLVRAYVYRDIFSQMLKGKEVDMNIPGSLDFRLWEMEQSDDKRISTANSFITEFKVLETSFNSFYGVIDNDIKELIDAEIIRLLKMRLKWS